MMISIRRCAFVILCGSVLLVSRGPAQPVSTPFALDSSFREETPVVADATATPTLARLVIAMRNFRNDKGQAAVALFDQPKGFPDKSRHAFRVQAVPIGEGRAEAVFESIPYGRYAVGVLHDENLNEKMDRNFFGIPREGFGVSGQGHTYRSTPRYEDALFDVASPARSLHISVHYMNR